MSRRGIITLPPAHADLAVSQACARAATPRIERALQVTTWLADEKVVLGAALLFWTYARLSRRNLAQPADHMLCCVALAATRIMLLAHYVSDVVGGFVLGLAIDKIVGRLLTSMRTALKSAAKNTQ